MGRYDDYKSLVKKNFTDFISLFLIKNMNLRWYYATRVDERERKADWRERHANAMFENPDVREVLCMSSFRGAERKSALWWSDVRKKIISMSELMTFPDSYEIVWLNDEVFIDPSFADDGRFFVRKNVLRCFRPEVEAAYPQQYSLARLVTSILRLSRTVPYPEMTKTMITEELTKVNKMRSDYAQRRADEEAEVWARMVRSEPQTFLDKIESIPTHKLSDREKIDIWALMLKYADKTRSSFYRAVMMSDPKKSLSRASSLMKRDEEVRGAAVKLDYILRAIPQSWNFYADIRKDLIGIIKDKRISDNRLAKFLEALYPIKGEELREYVSVLHDCMGVLPHITIFRPSLYMSGLLTSLANRSLNGLNTQIKTLIETPPDLLEKVMNRGPKSLKQATEMIQIALNDFVADEISGGKGPLYDLIQDEERLIKNSILCGRPEVVLRLLREGKVSSAEQTINAPIKISLDEIGVSVEVSEVHVPDGWLAMAISSVCVSFGGTAHMSQFRHDGGYLCVYDEDRIVLGGYLVDGGDYMLLNNLQGTLSNRHKTPEKKRMIAEGIRNALLSIGKPVVFRDLMFNGFSLAQNLDVPHREISMTLPNIYLDNPDHGEFYVIEPGGDENEL